MFAASVAPAGTAPDVGEPGRAGVLAAAPGEGSGEEPPQAAATNSPNEAASKRRRFIGRILKHEWPQCRFLGLGHPYQREATAAAGGRAVGMREGATHGTLQTMSGTKLVLIMVGGAVALVVVFQAINQLS